MIRPRMDARMGTNIKGPLLIRVPNWIDGPLGIYYFYFADPSSFSRLHTCPIRHWQRSTAAPTPPPHPAAVEWVHWHKCNPHSPLHHIPGAMQIAGQV